MSFIEIIVSLVIFAILIVFGTTIFSLISKNYNYYGYRIDQMADAQATVEASYIGLNAETIEASYSGTGAASKTITIDGNRNKWNHNTNLLCHNRGTIIIRCRRLIMNKRKKGISLAELLAVLTISAIIIIGALVIYNIGWQSYNISTKKAEIQRSMLNAYEIISEYTRFATEVSIGDNLSTDATNGTEYRVFLCE